MIFLCVNMRFLIIEPEITMNCKDEVTCREIGRELVADWSRENKWFKKVLKKIKRVIDVYEYVNTSCSFFIS